MENEDKIKEESTEKNELTEETTENSAEIPTPEEKTAESSETLIDYKAKYEEVNDKFMRLYSEFDNSKKRNVRERIELIKSAGSDVLKTILPILDDFDRAIKANQTATDIEAVKAGFNLINQKLYNSLEAKGLKKMDVVGQTLDTELHEAITQIPAPSDEMKGKVVDVVENGFYINEVVLRHAKVIVGS